MGREVALIPAEFPEAVTGWPSARTGRAGIAFTAGGVGAGAPTEDTAGDREDEDGREAPETGTRGSLLLGGPAGLVFVADTGNVLALTEAAESAPATDNSVEVRILDRGPS